MQGEHTVFVVGTTDGYVKKVLSSTKQYSQRELFSFSPVAANEQDRAIRSNPVFDQFDDSIYLASGKTVVKFPVGSCAIHTDCASCLKSEDPLGCGWCNGQCMKQSECRNSGGNFSRTTCSPELFEFSPLKGPIDGETELSITGDNFGAMHDAGDSHFSNISVTVAGHPCLIVEWKSNSIKCKTARVSQNTEGPVIIYVRDMSRTVGPYDIDGHIVSNKTFSFLKPALTAIEPAFGPTSGGTKLKIKGVNLDVGVRRKILVGDAPCKEERFDSVSITCTTGKTRGSGPSAVEVEIDGLRLQLPTKSATFNYKPDPEIFDVTPNTTIQSGGTIITATGLHLNSVARPRMNVTFRFTEDSKSFTRSSNCTVRVQLFIQPPSFTNRELFSTVL